MTAPCFPPSAARRRLLSLAILLLLLAPMTAGCVRIKATITISPNDQVSGQIVVAAQPRNDTDAGPQLSAEDLPFSHKVAISTYDRDGLVGSKAVFSDLTFAELPQLVNMNPDGTAMNLSLRRAGNLVILEGRVDLTALEDLDDDVEFSVTFPGEVTSTNGERIGEDAVAWKLRSGLVSTMSAQARYIDPSTRAFNHAAVWLAISSLVAVGLVAYLAWRERDTSPRFTSDQASPGDQ